MNTNRLLTNAAKSSSLNADSVLGYIPVDRNLRLVQAVIVAKSNITADNTNFSKFQIKNGSTVIIERSYASGDHAAGDREILNAIADGTVNKDDVLSIEYDATGNGLAFDLDVLLVFELARG